MTKYFGPKQRSLCKALHGRAIRQERCIFRAIPLSSPGSVRHLPCTASMAGEAAFHGAAVCAVQALLLFLVPLVVLLVGGRRRSRRSKQRLNPPLPPCPPRALPVIGHLHLVGALPHVSFRDLARKHGRDLMLLRLGAVNTVVVSSPRAAAAVLRTHDHALASRARSAVADIIFYKRSDVAFAPYGEPWRQARKVVTTHMLSARKVHSFRHDREAEARIAVAKIRSAAAPVDMSDLLGSYANDVVCRAVLGRNHRDDGRNKLLRELIDINMSLLGGFNVEDYFPSLAAADVFTGMVVCPRAKRVRKRWDELLDKLIDEHGRHRQQDDAGADFIHVLLAQQEEYGLTTDNVKAILLDMFEAGTETTYLVLEFAMAELMNNRHVMDKLQAEVRGRRRAPAAAAVGKDEEGEPHQQDVVTEEELGDMAYLKATVKETLRLHPPVPLLLPHLSIADCEVDGYTIPAGTRLMVNAWAIARDPASWEAPDEFAPERFLPGGSAAAVDGKGKSFEFLPFGSGRRICPGINFSNTAVQMMLANLVYHFDWELPAGTMEVNMEETFSLSIRRKEKLLLVPVPRSRREE